MAWEVLVDNVWLHWRHTCDCILRHTSITLLFRVTWWECETSWNIRTREAAIRISSNSYVQPWEHPAIIRPRRDTVSLRWMRFSVKCAYQPQRPCDSAAGAGKRVSLPTGSLTWAERPLREEEAITPKAMPDYSLQMSCGLMNLELNILPFMTLLGTGK